MIIINSGTLRFDVLKGSFTKNDQLTASEYKDSFFYIPNITFSIANQVLSPLNHPLTKRKRDETEDELWSRGVVDARYRAWLEEMDNRVGVGRREAMRGNLTFGYVTKDASVPHARSNMLITPT